MLFTYRSIEICVVSLLLIVSIGSIANNVGLSTTRCYVLDWGHTNTTVYIQ